MNKVKKLNTPQFWLIIITLICGIAYLLFNPNTKGTDNTNHQIEHSPDLATPATKPVLPSAAITPATPSEQSINLAINHWQTSNKVGVYFVQAQELPMVDIEVTFKAGSAYETQKPGVAALTNAMLDEGTKNHSNEEISETLESIGAIYNASLDKDKSSISLRSVYNKDDKNSIANFNKALNIFNDLLANANFPAKNFNRIKNQAIEGLKLSHQYPETITSETFYNLVYPNHPYGIPAAGTLESVNKITRQDLVNFYAKYYNNNNAQIAVVGDLSISDAKELAETIAINLKPGSAAPSLPDVAKLTTVNNKVINFPSSQTHILLGSVGIKRDDPDYFALSLGNHILGSMPLTSQLFKNVRIDRGLAYSVSSKFIAMKNEGPFIIAMQTRNEKAAEALAVSKETLDKFLKNGPTEAELMIAKQNLTGQFPVNISSNSQKLNIVSNIGFYNLPLDYLNTYINNINNLTAQDVTTAFNKHVNLGNMVIVTVGDSNNIINSNSEHSQISKTTRDQ